MSTHGLNFTPHAEHAKQLVLMNKVFTARSERTGLKITQTLVTTKVKYYQVRNLMLLKEENVLKVFRERFHVYSKISNEQYVVGEY